MTEGSAGPDTHQDHWRPSVADWITGAVAIGAVWDYYRVDRSASRFHR
jgi:hypothetical protein